MFETSNRLAKLGAEADKLQVLFVSVNPERGTPQQLALYLQSFDKRIIGQTGKAAQVDAAVKAFEDYAKKVPADAGYTMDRSSSVYVIGAKGGLRTIVDYHEGGAAGAGEDPHGPQMRRDGRPAQMRAGLTARCRFHPVADQGQMR